MKLFLLIENAMAKVKYSKIILNKRENNIFKKGLCTHFLGKKKNDVRRKSFCHMERKRF